MNRDNILTDTSLWCSPDFTATRMVGTEEDHALLMASIMRTCKHEDQIEFNKNVKKEKKKFKPKDFADKKLLTLDEFQTKDDDENDEEEENKDTD